MRMNSRYWSPEEVAVMRDMAERGAKARSIATVLKRSEASVTQKAFKLRISIDGRGHSQAEFQTVIVPPPANIDTSIDLHTRWEARIDGLKAQLRADIAE